MSPLTVLLRFQTRFSPPPCLTLGPRRGSLFLALLCTYMTTAGLSLHNWLVLGCTQTNPTKTRFHIHLQQTEDKPFLHTVSSLLGSEKVSLDNIFAWWFAQERLCDPDSCPGRGPAGSMMKPKGKLSNFQSVKIQGEMMINVENRAS